MHQEEQFLRYDSCQIVFQLAKMHARSPPLLRKITVAGQCITPERAARNVDSLGWDGKVLACGQMMG